MQFLCYYFQHVDSKRECRISRSTTHFCDLLVSFNDKLCWEKCISCLIHFIDSGSFRWEQDQQLTNAMEFFDSCVGTNRNTICERLPGIELKTLPYLFLFVPRYVLTFYYDDFLKGVLGTAHFTMVGFSLLFSDASQYSNWFMAGVHVFYSHCDTRDQFLPMLQCLHSIPSSSSLFSSVTKKDLVAVAKMTWDDANEKKQMTQLLSDSGTYLLLVLYCVFDTSDISVYLNELHKRSPEFGFR